MFLIAGALFGSSPAGADAGPYDEAIARAVRLLPRQPAKVVLVDRASQSHLHGNRPKVEAFIYRGDTAVYLVRHGSILRGAVNRGEILDYALAAIIWHEMAHVGGADEPAAQRAEEQLWKEFIIQRRVDQTRGMEYLTLLSNRR